MSVGEVDVLAKSGLYDATHAPSETELAYLRRAFCLCDTDGSGTIDASELGEVMRSCNFNPTDEQLRTMIAEIDSSGKGDAIDFSDFLRLIGHHPAVFQAIRQLMKKAAAVKKTDKDAHENRELDYFRLRFRNPELETAFMAEYLAHADRIQRAMWTFSVLALALLAQSALSDERVWVIMCWTIFAGLLALLHLYFMMADQMHVVRHLPFVLACFIGLSSLSLAAGHLLSMNFTDIHTHPCVLGLLFISLLTLLRPPFMSAVTNVVVGLCGYGIMFGIFQNGNFPARHAVCNFLELAMVSGVGTAILYSSEVYFRQVFLGGLDLERNSAAAQSEADRANRLLENILPKEVVRKTLEGARFRQFSRTYPYGSVLQTDICGFTTLSSTMTAHQVISLVDTMVTKFDAIVVALEVEKIKTIGDAYIMADYFHECHMERIADCGLSVIEAARSIMVPNGSGLTIRAGMASGEVAAGIIGFKKCIYDLFGETLKAVEKMEQTSKPMQLQCQKHIAEALSAKYTVDQYGFQFFISGKRYLLNEEWQYDQRQELLPKDAIPEDYGTRNSGSGHDPDDFLFSRTHISPASSVSSPKHLGTKGMSLNFDDLTSEQLFRTYLTRLSIDREVPQLFFGFVASLLIPIPFLLLGDEDHLHDLAIISAVGIGVHLLFMALVFLHSLIISMQTHHRPLMQTISIYRSQHERTLTDNTNTIHIDVAAAPSGGDDESEMNGRNHVQSRNQNGGHVAMAEKVSVHSNDASPMSPFHKKDSTTAPATVEGESYSPSPLLTRSSQTFQLTSILSTLIIVLCLLYRFTHGSAKDSSMILFPLTVALMYVSSSTQLRFPYKVAVAVALYGAMVAIVFGLRGANGPTIYLLVTVAISFVLVLMFAYYIERAQRDFFSASRIAVKKRDEIVSINRRVDRMLSTMLPKSVIERLLNQQTVVDEVSMASCVFVYLMPTDTSMTSNQLIQCINNTMYRLDEIVHQFPFTEKIKTNPYMVVTGIPAQTEDHAKILARLALQLLKAIREAQETTCSCAKVQIKIGMHSGPISAGLVGDLKWVYDCFGDTINTTARVASSSDWGRLQVSERTYELLMDQTDLVFEPRGQLDLKGKGLIRCFFVSHKSDVRSNSTGTSDPGGGGILPLHTNSGGSPLKSSSGGAATTVESLEDSINLRTVSFADATRPGSDAGPKLLTHKYSIHWPSMNQSKRESTQSPTIQQQQQFGSIRHVHAVRDSYSPSQIPVHVSRRRSTITGAGYVPHVTASSASPSAGGGAMMARVPSDPSLQPPTGGIPNVSSYVSLYSRGSSVSLTASHRYRQSMSSSRLPTQAFPDVPHVMTAHFAVPLASEGGQDDDEETDEDVESV